MKTLLDSGREGLSLAGFEIIDMHAHLGPFAYSIPDLSSASLVQVMDRIGVTRMVCSHVSCMAGDAAQGNREVLAAMRAFPGRIMGYVVLPPDSARAVQEEAERCLAEGFAGFKVHNANGIPYRHAAYEPAYKLADERRLPVLLHTWGEPAVLQEVSELAARYPGATFLVAHAGSANESAYVALVRERPNVGLDLAFSQSPRGLVKRFVDAVGAGRVVWGSDVYCFSQTQQIGKVLGADIAEEDKRRILSGNARRILAGAGLE